MNRSRLKIQDFQKKTETKKNPNKNSKHTSKEREEEILKIYYLHIQF